MASYEELRKEYVKLAKRADQRMLRLERLSELPGFRHVKEWAYAKAAKMIEVYTGYRGDKPRFNRQIPKDEKKLMHYLGEVKNFLYNMKTTTKKDIKNVYQRRVDTLNESMRIASPDWKDITLNDLDKVAESGLLDGLKGRYGSDTTFDVISTLERNGKQLKNAIKEAEEKHISIKDTDAMQDLNLSLPLEDAINNELEQYGLSIFDMI